MWGTQTSDQCLQVKIKSHYRLQDQLGCLQNISQERPDLPNRDGAWSPVNDPKVSKAVGHTPVRHSSIHSKSPQLKLGEMGIYKVSFEFFPPYEPGMTDVA